MPVVTLVAGDTVPRIVYSHRPAPAHRSAHSPGWTSMGLLALQRPTLTGQSACSDLDASSGWDVGRSATGSAVGTLASLN